MKIEEHFVTTRISEEDFDEYGDRPLWPQQPVKTTAVTAAAAWPPLSSPTKDSTKSRDQGYITYTLN